MLKNPLEQGQKPADFAVASSGQRVERDELPQLTEADRVRLQPHLPPLTHLMVYEASDVLAVLMRIPDDTPGLAAWKSEMQNALDHLKEVAYQNLIHI